MNSDRRIFGPIRSKVTARAHIEDELASFGSATGWLNSEPLAAADLRGKVVLIDFWTYTCINWLRTLPYIRAWAAKYQDHGLVTVGVHTPEFEFEENIDNVRSAVRDLRVDYPVAIDNRYTIWQAFATSTGRPSISPMRRGVSGTTISAKADTSSRKYSSSSSWMR